MMFQVEIEALDEFARDFWAEVKPEWKVFAFHGSMGAGKTTIITALCKHKGVKDTISSPTFSIINEYRYTEDGEEKKIYHMDLYRLNSMEEVIGAGVEDCIYSDAICFVEWPEKAPALLDERTIHVYIEPVNEQVRAVRLEPSTAS